MQKIKLTESADFKLYCPFCGNLTIGEEKIDPCKHTLFIATDEGFEHTDSRLDIGVLEQLGYDNFDEMSDLLEFPESIMFAIYQPAPSFFGAYVGYLAD